MESQSKQEIWIKDWTEFVNRLFQDAEPYLAVRGDMPHARVSHGYAVMLMEHEGGFSVETGRQGIGAMELYRHLEENVKSWFFTQTALIMAQAELSKRRDLARQRKERAYD